MTGGGGAASDGFVYLVWVMKRASWGENPFWPCQVDGGGVYGVVPFLEASLRFLFVPLDAPGETLIPGSDGGDSQCRILPEGAVLELLVRLARLLFVRRGPRMPQAFAWSSRVLIAVLITLVSCPECVCCGVEWCVLSCMLVGSLLYI